jgi:hypothetical protein
MSNGGCKKRFTEYSSLRKHVIKSHGQFAHLWEMHLKRQDDINSRSKKGVEVGFLFYVYLSLNIK